MQIILDGDYMQRGVEWNRYGYYSKVHSQFIEVLQWCGLYFLYVRNKLGDFFLFLWVVVLMRLCLNVVVFVSDIIWNVYNSFGGCSNYVYVDQFLFMLMINLWFELK